MAKWYSIREAAAILDTSKTTVRRLMEELPPEDISAGSYRGQPTILLSQKGLDTLQGQRQAGHEAQQEAQQSAPSDSELIQELRDRIAAQERQITEQNEQIGKLTIALDKAQEATHAAQLLHAATAEQLRLLTAAKSAQDAQEPPPGPDTTPAADEAQEPQEATVEASTPTAEITGTNTTPRASFRDRLRILFTGR